ncbi:lipid-A-disaccharide synthase [Adhaeribacter arboris]|uniref:Lipid-A-disaccharide synthase n=1 Tax=Adhaeribacter arboris TaxID=2072846 RepID=A0A2T2YDQ3_9BACT|nr:lipid-A-disaccharide synthase [Adhaeribacter arboris]PSR53636.1 lipid-A-disaccharide synthase [Adhaeribacter arboris]
MKYYLIAGERSGDLHAAKLMQELQKQDANAEFRYWGGDMMQATGGYLVRHYRELAFMGFKEAITNLFKILRFLRECTSDIQAYNPDVVILVDYAGFNLRIAKFAKANNFKVFYYISPKIWAWNQGRVHTIKKLVDRMFVIMPFEAAFYQRFDYKVDYIGNPIADMVSAHQPNTLFRHQNNLPDKPIIAILPGSRKQEIESILSVMLSVIPDFPEYQFVVAAVSNLNPEYYRNIGQKVNVSVVTNQTYDLLANAQAALVTSGTATLETALFNVPQIVCYSTSTISYWIARAVIKVPYISLVNLIAGKAVVKELIQAELTSRNIIAELKKITEDDAFIHQQKKDYQAIRTLLGEAKSATKAAQLMVKYLTLNTRY